MKVTKLALLALGLTIACSNNSAQNLPFGSDNMIGEPAAVISALQQLQSQQSTHLNPKLVKGALNFFLPFPGGNGRSCATCHVPDDGFSLSPTTVEARWQRLQSLRRLFPKADDPLFRSIDADDGKEDFTLLRTRALI